MIILKLNVTRAPEMSTIFESQRLADYFISRTGCSDFYGNSIIFSKRKGILIFVRIRFI